MIFKNFKDRSNSFNSGQITNKSVTHNLYNLCIVFLYNMVLNFAISIFALFFFPKRENRKFSKNKVTLGSMCLVIY